MTRPHTLRFALLTAVCCGLAHGPRAAAQPEGPFGCHFEAYLVPSDTHLETAPLREPEQEPAWQPLKPGDVFLGPTQFQIENTPVLQMTEDTLESGAAVSKLWPIGKGSMVLNIGQKTGLWLEGKDGSYTHSVEFKVPLPTEDGLCFASFAITPLENPIAPVPQSPPAVRPQAPVKLESTVPIEMWVGICESAGDEGTVLLFVRFTLPKKDCE